jgi:hypothetical protein
MHTLSHSSAATRGGRLFRRPPTVVRRLPDDGNGAEADSGGPQELLKKKDGRGPTSDMVAILNKSGKKLKSSKVKTLQFRIKMDGVLRLLQQMQIIKMKKTGVNSSITAGVIQKLQKKQR